MSNPNATASADLATDAEAPGAEAQEEPGEGAGRQRRGSAVVAAVLAATREELVRVGYFELRIDEVARLAGVNKTTVYRRWPNRVALVRDALAEHLFAVELPKRTGQVHEDLRRHMYALCSLTDTPVGAAMLAAKIQGAEHPEVLSLFAQMRVLHEEVPRKVLVRGVADGQLRADLKVDLALAMIHGAFQFRLSEQPCCIETDFIDSVLEMILGGILIRPQS